MIVIYVKIIIFLLEEKENYALLMIQTDYIMINDTDGNLYPCFDNWPDCDKCFGNKYVIETAYLIFIL